ncbi:hypothetical protein TWF569_000529 [Orbilia oligospora]|uniref:Meiotically up-regulated gene 190 protein n=2 Tax=Orbilia oligospora TaxID=2813651 RepID=A0A7C8NM22_ORBOL|nr:hypothetical protein TWF102_004256 [Orbilia oligospora]KAF3117791.1 hypothetical protein TWF103_004465 [Orbilia oligospora]KAF3126452.1 hypothetical protein TWF569_000529 [Orbilia oligospora]
MSGKMDFPSFQPEPRQYGEPYTTQHRVPNIREYKEQLQHRNKNKPGTVTPKAEPGPGDQRPKDIQHTPPETPTDGSFDRDSDNALAAQLQTPQEESLNGIEDFQNRPRKDSYSREPMSPAALAQDSMQSYSESSGENAEGGQPQWNSKSQLKVREVTDPVTHLPVNIHDFTTNELQQVKDHDDGTDQNMPGEKGEVEWSQKRHDSLEALVENELRQIQRESKYSPASLKIIAFGLVIAGIIVNSTVEFMFITLDTTGLNNPFVKIFAKLAIGSIFGVTVAAIIQRYTREPSTSASPARESKEKSISQKQLPETAAWLNNTLSSVWPLVNPDLFVTLADMLEDVMQASLPRFVKMVRIADLGQGNEPLRVLGIRWLREGAASQSIDGMEAEEGDFVNLELAVAYKSRPSDKSVKSKVKNAHLLLEFYLAGAIPLPIWVELKGMIGTIRVRLQTTPDPPFFGQMTFTFLGQPKITLSCIPLMKKMPNIMDVPIISSFVQSSVDAAMSEYVAPKSLTLDLKKTLIGDDFKTDVNGKGVLVIRIISAEGFKNGDGTKSSTEALGKVIGLSGQTGSDPYVSLSWSKYGKSLWLSRIITKCQTPVWDETAVLIVGYEELNAEEKLQITLWDSDRTTADDHLGTVQVDLKDLLHENEDGAPMTREDEFTSRTGDKKMPGTIKWEVSWFPRTKLSAAQIKSSSVATQEQKSNPNELFNEIKSATMRKTREARHEKDSASETDQQLKEDIKFATDEISNNAPPPQDFPSGILSIQIHQISSLTLQQHSTSRTHHNESIEESEEGSDLPSSYCTVTINHRKVYKTRVKPKSSIPFFNAATERFIKDWRSAEVIVGVHDNRLHENNPILGCVVLPLSHVFRKRSQVCENYPLVGGLGYGRIRISMVWRSVTCQIPKQLLGWDVGTLEVLPEITGLELPQEIQECARVVVSTSYGKKSKIPAVRDGSGAWKRERQVYVPIKQRYSSCVLFSFRKNRVGPDGTPAFAVLWLKDVPDDEECEKELAVWDNDGDNIVTAEKNAVGEYGKKLGSIKVRTRFWSGLTGYHRRLSKKDSQMKGVMEILECASEGKELRDEVEGGSSSDSSSDSSESSSDEELQESGDRGVIKDLKEYKKNKKELHRHHRGLMQWKALRGIDWAKDQVKDTTKEVVHKVTARDTHEQDKNKIETEV